MSSKNEDTECFTYKPIGYIRSIFQSKNGTPRQSGLSELARARLTVTKEVFTNPEHSLANLGDFSHLWLLWVFHQDSGNTNVKAKVAPPRLGGGRVGVFSSRSPHRPANIGLTLARLERVEGDTVHLAGVDILDNTPVLDIKPYIPQYDSPQPRDTGHTEDLETLDDVSVRVPQWIGDPGDDLNVIFSSRAETQLRELDVTRLQWLRGREELRAAIRDVLRSDPRSVYRKTKCSDRMYFTSIDSVHVTAWYDPDIDGMEVIKVKLEDKQERTDPD